MIRLYMLVDPKIKKEGNYIENPLLQLKNMRHLKGKVTFHMPLLSGLAEESRWLIPVDVDPSFFPDQATRQKAKRAIMLRVGECDFYTPAEAEPIANEMLQASNTTVILENGVLRLRGKNE